MLAIFYLLIFTLLMTFPSDFGQRSFSVATPMAWYELPGWLRNVQRVDAFKTALKTFDVQIDLLINTL